MSSSTHKPANKPTHKLTPDQRLAAANILAQRRLQGICGERLPVSLRPDSIEEAMQIQGLLAGQLDDKIAGWKCGMPGDGKIVVAPIFSRTVYHQHQHAICKVCDEDYVKIEPELAFVLSSDLPARATPYSDEEILAAISHAQLALEIIGCRYRDPASTSFAELLADGLFNQGLYLGPAITTQHAMQQQTIDLTLKVEGQETQSLAGLHPATNPLSPLFWLVNYLRQHADGLRAGQAIITGSYAGSPVVPMHNLVQVQYADSGSITVCFERG
ncbi:fumarylacetoacetate hydrolase family protein [Undibacterium sp. SXout20W]|uniref:fumarylacetoacetate hydrolase family protein n=1 Tax=Undibacterium sp. SXout20W TaxID=3413051 RepID=UPI003BF3E6D3